MSQNWLPRLWSYDSCNMDTFKGQDNDVTSNLCGDNNYAIVKVPHNLTNKFQPIDITVNKPAKYFISEKYNK